ncbi:hypothetical protein EJ05DRAFT_483188 [Pseudovirgaria hyperparasitica]|uniref:Uncharacterized protein n=1 Tax=Pseudovirgaria hyperparasitica TaxID=470096 RepID=A0A6A6WFC3_9PEZI|nr:uncharacterized protein EJ05DRAFT_483188 [Pseudovirgaria hyperparasitica]KAF2760734.1 hypothetical protein EJ05DRAFT_483188 [Pseudovirgaria hyperparasitica]
MDTFVFSMAPSSAIIDSFMAAYVWKRDDIVELRTRAGSSGYQGHKDWAGFKYMLGSAHVAAKATTRSMHEYSPARHWPGAQCLDPESDIALPGETTGVTSSYYGCSDQATFGTPAVKVSATRPRLMTTETCQLTESDQTPEWSVAKSVRSTAQNEFEDLNTKPRVFVQHTTPACSWYGALWLFGPYSLEDGLARLVQQQGLRLDGRGREVPLPSGRICLLPAYQDSRVFVSPSRLKWISKPLDMLSDGQSKSRAYASSVLLTVGPVVPLSQRGPECPETQRELLGTSWRCRSLCLLAALALMSTIGDESWISGRTVKSTADAELVAPHTSVSSLSNWPC